MWLVHEVALNASKDSVKKESHGKTDTSHSVSNKNNAGVEDNDATKPRGLQVPMTETRNLLDLLKLFNQNDKNQKPTAHISPGKIESIGGPGNNGKKVPEKKVPEKKADNKTPAKIGEKKLPLRPRVKGYILFKQIGIFSIISVYS